MVMNPRDELYSFSYAEQDTKTCDTIYVKEFNEIVISGCSHVSKISSQHLLHSYKCNQCGGEIQSNILVSNENATPTKMTI